MEKVGEGNVSDGSEQEVSEVPVQEGSAKVVFEEGDGSKKKWWIVGILLGLIVIGSAGAFIYITIEERNGVGSFFNEQKLFYECLSQCPFDQELIDYENGVGNLDPERTMEFYGGEELIHTISKECMNSCSNERDFSEEDSAIQRDQERVLEIRKGFSDCVNLFRQDEISSCYKTLANSI